MLPLTDEILAGFESIFLISGGNEFQGTLNALIPIFNLFRTNLYIHIKLMQIIFYFSFLKKTFRHTM